MTMNCNFVFFSVRPAADPLCRLSCLGWLDEQPVGVTQEKSFSLKDLKSSTNYSVQIQYITPFGDSLCSAPTTFRTEDECE